MAFKKRSPELPCGEDAGDEAERQKKDVELFFTLQRQDTDKLILLKLAIAARCVLT